MGTPTAAVPATRTPSFRTVKTFWKALAIPSDQKWNRVTETISNVATMRGSPPGNTFEEYCANAREPTATGPANPTVTQTQPATNPTAGW